MFSTITLINRPGIASCPSETSKETAETRNVVEELQDRVEELEEELRKYRTEEDKTTTSSSSHADKTFEEILEINQRLESENANVTILHESNFFQDSVSHRSPSPLLAVAVFLRCFHHKCIHISQQ